MLTILSTISPLFLIIFGSAFLPKLKIADDSWIKVLNNFALKIGLPALIFSALSRTSLQLESELGVVVANSVFLLVSFLVVILLRSFFRMSEKLTRTLFICFAFGNIAYLGIPVLVRISGDTILPQASLIVAVYLFWIFTVGIGYLEHSLTKKGGVDFKKILARLIRNPLLIAVVAGIAFSVLEIRLPGIVNESISLLAASVTPVVLVVIGLFLGTTKIDSVRQWSSAFLFSILTLLVLPGLFYVGLQLSGYSPVVFSTSILDAAMPLAITPFALAHEYKLDADFIARSIVLSTILSVISLPFWISVLSF